MKVSKEVPYMFLSAIGVFIATSAYIVYTNTLKTLPMGASYFWFVFFAFWGSLLLPQEFAGFREHSFRVLYPEMPWVRWFRSVQQIKPWQIFTNGLLFTIYFGALLWCIRQKDPAAVLTLLVISQLKTIANAILGYKYLGDTFKSWKAYVFGAAVAITGVCVFKYEQSHNSSIALFDMVVLGAIISNTASVVRGIFDARVKRPLSISQGDMVASTMVGASVIGFVWMMVESGFSLPQLPTPNQWGALIYLGVMPTAISSIVSNTVRDKLSFQVADMMDNLRPLFAIFCGMIPFAWFSSPTKYLNWKQFIAIGLTIIGVAIVVFFARGERKT